MSFTIAPMVSTELPVVYDHATGLSTVFSVVGSDFGERGRNAVRSKDENRV